MGLKMAARTLMIQGTASHVGKSVITTGLCRWLARQGWRVAPFKAQNMSLNSAVTAAGEEIGRSQAFQAAACGIEPEAAMNPVLLKPMGGGRCSVLVRGKPHRIAQGHGTAAETRQGLEIAAECLAELRSRFDIVVLEGMGSPAEINLPGRDGANMRVAALAEAPVLLVGDIERGGVFAALAGTLELLAPEDRERVGGLLINKFHGDPAGLAPGTEELRRRYGVPTLGVLPWLPTLRVEEEDAVALTSQNAVGRDEIDVVVPRIPGLSNFTDLDALRRDPGVRVRYVTSPAAWGDPDLVVLPGSRSVAADLEWLRGQGLDRCVLAAAAVGRQVVGLCGGYQMLGREILDPDRVEGGRAEGLGLLDVSTSFSAEKRLERVEGDSLLPGLAGLPVRGYEIHHGVTVRGPEARPVFRLHPERLEGAADADLRVWGTYLHGVFDSDPFRHAFLRKLGWAPRVRTPEADPFDRLADWIEAHVDTAAVRRLLHLEKAAV